MQRQSLPNKGSTIFIAMQIISIHNSTGPAEGGRQIERGNKILRVKSYITAVKFHSYLPRSRCARITNDSIALSAFGWHRKSAKPAYCLSNTAD